jgi:hypothetical protein
MVTTSRLRTRTALTGGLTLLVLAVGVAPAWAADPMPGSANDTLMPTGQALLVFLGIPLLVAAIIWLLVLAPGWTRGGRPSSADAWTGDALVVGSGEGTAAAPALAPGASAEQTGGTSASW